MVGELWYVVWCVLGGGLSGVCGFGLHKTRGARASTVVVGSVSETQRRADAQVGSGLGSHVRARCGARFLVDAVSQDRRDEEMQRCQRCRDNVRVK